MKTLFLAYSWILLTAGLILTGVAGYQYIELRSLGGEVLPPLSNTFISLGASLSTDEQTEGVSAVIETADARAELVANFLERHNSPMTPYDYYGQKLVEIADANGLDFRLLPAIAMQESNLCKVIPENSYNCLGFGVHSRGTLRFPSYEEAFETAARTLKKNYIDIGLTTPELIMTKYTPHSNGSWAASVNQWMAEMRYDDRDLGRTLKTDADVLEFVPDASSSATGDSSSVGDN